MQQRLEKKLRLPIYERYQRFYARQHRSLHLQISQ